MTQGLQMKCIIAKGAIQREAELNFIQGSWDQENSRFAVVLLDSPHVFRIMWRVQNRRIWCMGQYWIGLMCMSAGSFLFLPVFPHKKMTFAKNYGSPMLSCKKNIECLIIHSRIRFCGNVRMSGSNPRIHPLQRKTQQRAVRYWFGHGCFCLLCTFLIWGGYDW